MKKLIVLFVAITFAHSVAAQTQWKADAYHSFLNFSVEHLGISFVNGKMDKYEGTLHLNGDDITTAKFNFTIDASSINTGVEMRDNHLRSADFFETEKYPQIKFVSTGIKKVKGDKYELTGDLTIKDVTKRVLFDLAYGGKAKDAQGNEVMGFQAKTTVDRTVFNIKYDPTGGAIAKDVTFKINLEFKKG